VRLTRERAHYWKHRTCALALAHARALLPHAIYRKAREARAERELRLRVRRARVQLWLYVEDST
jgi:hypothetical protein